MKRPTPWQWVGDNIADAEAMRALYPPRDIMLWNGSGATWVVGETAQIDLSVKATYGAMGAAEQAPLDSALAFGVFMTATANGALGQVRTFGLVENAAVHTTVSEGDLLVMSTTATGTAGKMIPITAQTDTAAWQYPLAIALMDDNAGVADIFLLGRFGF